MYHVIINPTAKTGLGLRIWQRLQPIVEEYQMKCKLYYSEYVGHMAQLVKEIEEENTKDGETVDIIILGGDGTVNEAIQGIQDFSKVRIGYIPTGSSNDLARDLDLPQEPEKILKRIFEGKVQHLMDLGILTYGDDLSSHRFAVSCGIGFDAAVCVEAMDAKSNSKTLLNRLGMGDLIYLAIALKHIFGAKPVSCDITLDHTEQIHLERFLFVASMIHRYEGGGFKFCPTAMYNDGLLDFCAVGKLPRWKILLAFPSAFKGNHLKYKGISAYQAKHMELKASAPLYVHTDGEVERKADHIIVSIEENVLQFLS